MKTKGLTLTIITQKATSLNYGESLGNVSALKKITMADNTQFTYISDKALRYDMKRIGKEIRNWNLLDEKIKEHVRGSIKNKKLDVDEFGSSLIKDYQEFDLFGGLFTNIKDPDIKEKNSKLKLSYGDSIKRTSVVKVSYGFSISPFKSDMDFMNNIDAYERYIKHLEDKENQAIAMSEQHTSHYVYTITVDLDRVGVWEKEDGSVEEVLDKQQKAERVLDFLDIIKNLNRQIRGRCENLSPVFLIGGVFSVKNPFFLGSVRAMERDGKIDLNLPTIKQAMELIPEEESAVCGLMPGVFHDENLILNELSAVSVVEAFEKLKEAVKNAYGVKS